MLNYMSGSQIASLFVGIVFSVLAVAGLVLVIKHSKAINSFDKSIAIVLVCPFIAYTSWMFLILSCVDAFKDNELLNLIVSILVGLFITVTVITIARTLYLKHYAEYEENNDIISEKIPNEVLSNNEDIVEVPQQEKIDETQENVTEEFEQETEETDVLDVEEEIEETQPSQIVPETEDEETSEDTSEEMTEETSENISEETDEISEQKDIDSKLVDALILTHILDEKEKSEDAQIINEESQSDVQEENAQEEKEEDNSNEVVSEENENSEEEPISTENQTQEVEENIEQESIDDESAKEESVAETTQDEKTEDNLDDIEIEDAKQENNAEEEVEGFLNEIREILEEEEDTKHTLTQDEIDDLEFEKYLDSLKKKRDGDKN